MHKMETAGLRGQDVAFVATQRIYPQCSSDLNGARGSQLIVYYIDYIVYIFPVLGDTKDYHLFKTSGICFVFVRIFVG